MRFHPLWKRVGTTLSPLVNGDTVNASTINASTINASTINAPTVNAPTVNANAVNADVMTVSKNQNGGTALNVVNQNTGIDAIAGVSLQNNIHSVQLVMTSTGFTDFPDTAVISTDAAGGIALSTDVGDLTLMPFTSTKTTKDIEITAASAGLILNSATKRWRVTVDNSGVLTTTEIV